MRGDIEKVRRIVASQVSRLDPVLLARWQASSVEPAEVSHEGLSGFVPSVFVVARKGQTVLIYDLAEEEFGVCHIGSDGVSRGYGTFGEELKWSLERFLQ